MRGVRCKCSSAPLHALAYNLGNFAHAGDAGAIREWSLTSLKEKLIKIDAKVVSHRRYITFQMAEVIIPTLLTSCALVAELRPPDPAPT